MIDSFHGLLPDQKERVRRLTEFWEVYRNSYEPGGTIREVLKAIQDDVKDALCCDPPDIVGAEGSTAKALSLMSGWSD